MKDAREDSRGAHLGVRSPNNSRNNRTIFSQPARCLWPILTKLSDDVQNATLDETIAQTSYSIVQSLNSNSCFGTKVVAQEHWVKETAVQTACWQDVPSDVLGTVVAKIGNIDVKSARLVCNDWRAAVSGNTLQLQPRALNAEQLASSFPAIRSLDLRRCKGLQDRDVEGLQHCVTLRVLCLDGCEGVTDAVLIEIRGLPRLTHLSVRNCVKLTDVGLAALSGATLQESSWHLLWSPRRQGAGFTTAADSWESQQHHFQLPRRVLQSHSGDATTPLHNPNDNQTLPSLSRGVPIHRREAACCTHETPCTCTSSSSSSMPSGSYGEGAVMQGIGGHITHPPHTPTCSPPPLQSLDLSGCLLLTERGMAAVAAGLGRSLTSLQLGGCSRLSTVTDSMLDGVGKATMLRALDLSGCTQITDAGLARLTTLQHLASLSLWNCMRVSEAGLSMLGALNQLSALSMRGCQQLGDAMLGMLGQLSLLRRLDLRACEAVRGEEFTQLSRLSQLSELNLRGCYGIIDPGLEAIGSLKGLQVLNLQECWQITERGLAHLSGLSSMMELNLQGCRNLANLPGSALPGLASLAGVTSLSLRKCDRICEGSLQCCSSMRSLKHLDISGCKLLTGASLAPLAALTSSLVTLRAQHCTGLQGPVTLCTLSSLQGLTALNLGVCMGLHGAALSPLRSVAGLRQLSLEGCRDMKGLDEGLVTLGPHTSLTSISLQGCSTLSDAGLEALGAFPALARINASDCSGISGEGCAVWVPLSTTLTSLHLQNSCCISDQGLIALAGALGGGDTKLPALQSLNLKHCKLVSDRGVAAVASALGRLTCLSLQGMVGLSDAGMAALGQLAALRELDVQFCWQFTDEGVQCLTTLTALSRLDLMYSWKVTDDALIMLRGMTSLLSLNVLGCHRLTPAGKAGVAHLLDSALEK